MGGWRGWVSVLRGVLSTVSNTQTNIRVLKRDRKFVLIYLRTILTLQQRTHETFDPAEGARVMFFFFSPKILNNY